MAHCPCCGSPVAEGAERCEACGEELSAETLVPDEMPGEGGASVGSPSRLIIALVAVLVAAVVLGLCLLLGGPGSSEPSEVVPEYLNLSRNYEDELVACLGPSHE